MCVSYLQSTVLWDIFVWNCFQLQRTSLMECSWSSNLLDCVQKRFIESSCYSRYSASVSRCESQRMDTIIAVVKIVARGDKNKETCKLDSTWFSLPCTRVWVYMRVHRKWRCRSAIVYRSHSRSSQVKSVDHNKTTGPRRVVSSALDH